MRGNELLFINIFEGKRLAFKSVIELSLCPGAVTGLKQNYFEVNSRAIYNLSKVLNVRGRERFHVKVPLKIISLRRVGKTGKYYPGALLNNTLSCN